VPIIGAVARTIDEWREHVIAGRGISLCPASSEVYHARPGLVFVPSKGVATTSLCVAWRADDERPAVRSFATLATSVARDGFDASGGAEGLQGISFVFTKERDISFMFMDEDAAWPTVISDGDTALGCGP
jgi:LysR substrate binding domain